MGEYAAVEGDLDATGMRFAIVAARFNREVTEPLCAGGSMLSRATGAGVAKGRAICSSGAGSGNAGSGLGASTWPNCSSLAWQSCAS